MQMHAPPLTKTNKIIISVLSAFFVTEFFSSYATSFSFLSFLGLSFSGIKTGFFFQLLTYPLISKSILSFLFSMLLIWFLGGELETRWGARFYQKYLGVVTLFTGIFFILLNLVFPELRGSTLFSVDALAYALLVGYALVFPERELLFMFLFPVKAKYFCLLLGVWQFFNSFQQLNASVTWCLLVSMVFSYAYLKYLSLKATGGLKKPKKKPKLRIVKDDDETPPKYWH